LGTAATTGLLYQPRMIGEGDCGEIDGMKIGRGCNSLHQQNFFSGTCIYLTRFVCDDVGYGLISLQHYSGTRNLRIMLCTF
jgi:hypothetical protein